MSIRARVTGIVNKLRSYGRSVGKSRADLADSVSAESVLPPIPPDKPPTRPRRRR